MFPFRIYGFCQVRRGLRLESEHVFTVLESDFLDHHRVQIERIQAVLAQAVLAQVTVDLPHRLKLSRPVSDKIIFLASLKK